MELNGTFSGLATRQIVITYWLIPSEPAYSFFRRIINDLAHRYDAPVFEPHVTIYVGVDSTDAFNATLSKAARDCEPIMLQTLEVRHSDEFIKTLFVQFAMNRQLQQVNQSIRAEVQDSSDYQLNPHLSLLYKRMSIQERCLLTRSIEVPLPEVAFDSLKAVRCVSPTRNRADVEAWRVIGEKPLGSIGV